MEDSTATRRVITGPSGAGAMDVYAYRGVGRRTSFDAEMIENVLWEVATTGGSCLRALNNLKEHHALEAQRLHELGEPVPEEPGWPSVETVRRWVRVQYRNRYHEIAVSRARELEERNAVRATERAIAIDDSIAKALKRVDAGVDNLDAVEASTVIRNLAGAQKQQVDIAAGVRRQGQQSRDTRDLIAIGENLVRMGVGAIREAQVVDAEVVGEGEGDPPSLPAGD